MPDYRRILSYLYRYENRIKKDCKGFIKAEKRNDTLKLTIQLQDEHRIDNMNLKLCFYQKEDTDWKVWNLDQLFIEDDQEEKILHYNKKDLPEQFDIQDQYGVVLYYQDSLYYGSVWIGEEIPDDLIFSDQTSGNVISDGAREQERLKESDKRNRNLGKAASGKGDSGEAGSEQGAGKPASEKTASGKRDSGEAGSEQGAGEPASEKPASEKAASGKGNSGKAGSGEAAGKESPKKSDGKITGVPEPGRNKTGRKIPERKEPDKKYSDVEGSVEDERKEHQTAEETPSELKITECRSKKTAPGKASSGKASPGEASSGTASREKVSPERSDEKGSDVPKPGRNKTGGKVPCVRYSEDMDMLEPIRNQAPAAEKIFNSAFYEGYQINTSQLMHMGEEADLLSSNQFLLKGYGKYHHLLAGRVRYDGEDRYCIGVPGVYENREKYMAQLYQFPVFLSLTENRVKTGRFGYWLHIL